jgi:uncharacterized protein (DUF1778 family)
MMVRLDRTGKQLVQRVAELRGVSTSDYVRTVVLANARRDIMEAERNIVALSVDEQLAFWGALNQSVDLTRAQRRLAETIQGRR